MTLTIFTSDRFADHLMPPGHPERIERAEGSGLRVLRRPARGVLGAWAVGTRRDGAVEVWVESLDPLRTSCGCADFARSGLGLCEHALVALDAVPERTWKRGAPPRPVTTATLRWDPQRPLRGTDDRLASRLANVRLVKAEK